MRRVGLYSAIVALTIACLTAASARLAAAAPLEQVKQNGSLRLCANPAAPPYSNRSASDDMRGFQVDLAQTVAREMGLGLTVVWVQGVKAAKAADCDISMDARPVAAHYEREGQTGPLMPTVLTLRFTKPYAGSGLFLVVPTGSPVRRFDDLDAEKIGVVVDSVAHQWLQKKGLKVSSFAFQDDILAAIETGEIGAGVVASPAVGWYRHEHPDAKVMIPDGYEPEPALRWNVSVALWRADDALVDALNAAIDRVIEQRLQYDIYAKYGVTYHRPFSDAEKSEQ
jgi:polar amino acid transport system substrate-binding protein